jgi:hypothetical protein
MGEKKARAAHFALCMGAIAFFVSYGAPLLVTLPQLWYLPVARSWVFGTKPVLLSMDWYGRTLGSVVICLVVNVAAYMLARRSERIARIGPRILGIFVLLTFLGAIGLYLEHLVDRQVSAEPLPAWYQPR